MMATAAVSAFFLQFGLGFSDHIAQTYQPGDLCRFRFFGPNYPSRLVSLLSDLVGNILDPGYLESANDRTNVARAREGLA